MQDSPVLLENVPMSVPGVFFEGLVLGSERDEISCMSSATPDEDATTAGFKTGQQSLLCYIIEIVLWTNNVLTRNIETLFTNKLVDIDKRIWRPSAHYTLWHFRLFSPFVSLSFERLVRVCLVLPWLLLLMIIVPCRKFV